MFAENIYNYEKRIANAILVTKSNGTATQIMTLNDVKKAAPSVRINLKRVCLDTFES